jgi:hypothetical protein
MRLLINHLTRMHGGHICLAGVDLETRRHVRPVLAHEPLPFYLLARYGGPFEMARIVDLGSPRHTPEPPHIEDHVYVPARARMDRPAAAHEFWQCLQELERTTLHEIFGAALHEVRPGRWGTLPGQGAASLGLLRPAKSPRLYLTAGHDGGRRIRLRFCDGQIEADASVADLRLFGDDHATPQPARIRALSEWIADSHGVILSVGLTRQFSPSDDHEPRHWLQINNIHRQEDPTWALG